MAYAAVISLKHNVEQLLHIDDPIPTVINQQITKDAYAILCSLGDILQTLDNKRDQSFDIAAIKALDTEMRKAAWKLEDELESYALQQMQMQMQMPMKMKMPLVVEQQIQSFINTSEKFVRDFSRLIENNLETEEEEEEDEGDVSAIGDFGGSKLTTIGLFMDGFIWIMKKLMDPYSLLVVSLVGMAGIGKTHFAREIYQHPLVVEHFEFTVWVRLGQKCASVKKILVEILAQIDRKPRNTYVDEDEETLFALFRKSLDGVCLVVLDDVWSEVVCRDIISRLYKFGGLQKILLTTRIVYTYGPPFIVSSFDYQMPFWDKEKSWNLLWQSVFPGRSSFPPQLEKAGRKIAENCEGLPLLIVVVANILSGADKTEEYWNKVANKKTTTFIDAYEKISKTLFSSYDYLPEHLKACFLYMGVFPQSCEIPLNKLINLLAVEDFLEPRRKLYEQRLGEFFYTCVKRLVFNSIVISSKDSSCNHGYYGMSSCKLHSAYWYLCVKEARNNKFMHVFNKLSDGSAVYIESQRRLAIQNNMLFGIKEVRESMVDTTTTARSLIFTGEHHQYPVPLCLDSMLFLRVLDAVAIRLYEFPEEVVKLLLLRYLSLTHNGKLSSSISNLQKLQFLIVGQHHNIKLMRDHFHSTFLPDEIWEMKQLEHLRIMGHNLPNPRNNNTQLPKLKTLYVSSHSCTEAVMRGVQNLYKLAIEIELEPESSGAESLGCLEHVGTLLENLHTLKCRVVNPRRLITFEQPQRLSNLLPKYLRKLSLNGLGCSWKFMSAIGSLPILEVLKLRGCAFEGPKWEMEAPRQFLTLEYMLLEDIDLVEWRVDNTVCFRTLRHLAIQHCFKLKEIPLAFGDRPYLLNMEVIDCSPSLVASATKIQLHNSSITFVINSSYL